MLDVSGSMEGNLALLREASQQLFPRLRQDDRVRVGSFGDEITISESSPMTRGSSSPRCPTRFVPMLPHRCGAPSIARSTAFKEEGDERPVILVLSDGKDSGPTDFRERPASQASVIDRARRENVMIYAVGMRSRSTQRQAPGIGPGGLQAMLTADLPDPGLARVAEETGGGYSEIRFGQDLGAAFAQVADELHSQYLIGFATAQARRQGARPRRASPAARPHVTSAQELRRPEVGRITRETTVFSRTLTSIRIVLNSIVVGQGRTLFETVEGRVDLRLTKTRAFTNGNVVLWYQPRSPAGSVMALADDPQHLQVDAREAP